MSVNNIDEISTFEDYFSAKSTISDLSESFESLNKQIDTNDYNSSDMCHRISNLQDIRYNATCRISQLKQIIIDIEKQEMIIMKESTIKHSNLQENYFTNNEEESYVKNLAEEAAVKLGKMKFELKSINEQVQLEQQKLEELEEQSDRLTKRLDDCEPDMKMEIRMQLTIIDEQRDQQAKIFEDLEFKELETQSRFEEESETLKSNIIEAQRKLIMSTRNRENRKLFYDEQQILLMKNTRKTLDKLESDRNKCNEKIAYYQNILNTCSSQIEEFNRQTNNVDYAGLLEQSWTNGDTINGVPDFNSISRGDCLTHSNITGPSYNPNSTLSNNSLQDRLDSLTEIVKMNLNMPNQSAIDTAPLKIDWVNNSKNQHLVDSSYPSTFSLSDESESLVKFTDSTPSLQRGHKPTTVTFECTSIEESTSSNQSPGPDSQTNRSRSHLNSETSNNDENSHPDSQIKSSVVRRNKEKYSSKRAKQLRPLTCFLPKLHSDFNLLKHIESCGHDLTVCGAHVQIDQNSCQGFLWKLSNRLFGVWKKRWFYFDHCERQLKYYNSKSKTKIKGAIDFQTISDVFVDHTHRAKNPQKLSLCIETQSKSYYLIAAKPELVTLWVDVIFTGAEAYLTLHHPSMLTSIISQSAE